MNKIDINALNEDDWIGVIHHEDDRWRIFKDPKGKGFTHGKHTTNDFAYICNIPTLKEWLRTIYRNNQHPIRMFRFPDEETLNEWLTDKNIEYG